MNILIIPDKFKDSLTAGQVVNAISKGINRCNLTHKIISIIASDGGDGFLNAIHQVHPGFEKITMNSVNPLGKKITAEYLFSDKDHTAYIELAKASGLELLKKSERNCNDTSTFGSGLQIKHALLNGAKNIYIGLGGSATNDGATGILRALGFKFLDRTNNLLETNGSSLQDIATIILPDKDLKNINFFTVNDVNNLLLGNSGATFTYALQKGATKSDLPVLEKGMENYFLQSKKLFPNLEDTSGFGAAGGTSFGLSTFLDAKIISGTDFLFQLNDLDKLLSKRKIDLIITGEGKIDKQTLNGKFIAGITAKAKDFKIPIIVICGISTLDEKSENELNVAGIYPIKTKDISTIESMKNAAKLIEQKAFDILNDLSKNHTS